MFNTSVSPVNMTHYIYKKVNKSDFLYTIIDFIYSAESIYF